MAYYPEVYIKDEGPMPEVDEPGQDEMIEAAVQAGIPRKVAEGKAKLTDYFSKEYIDWKCNRNQGKIAE